MKTLNKLKCYIAIYWKIQVQNIKSLEQYRIDFLMLLFFTTLSQICNLSLIGIIYSNTHSIGGWNMWEILMLYGYLSFSEGSVNVFFQGAWKITEMLNRAEIDRFLVRPLPIGLQIITAKIDFDGFNKIMVAYIVLWVGISHCTIEWSLWKIIYLLLTLIGACIIRFSMIWIASCSSFWTNGIKNTCNFFVLSLGEMAKYPLTIYPPFLNSCFAYIIPYAFVNYFPVTYLLGKQVSLWNTIMIPVVCISTIIISNVVLKLGLRRYESNGN